MVTRAKGSLAASVLVLATSVVCLACTGASARDQCANDPGTPIESYCRPIVTAFCHHAVDDCGASGTVDGCILRALPTCCQGACGRLACTADTNVIATCIEAYGGPATSYVLDGGADSGAGGGPGGLACASVLQGVAPPECRSIVTLKGDVLDDRAR